MHNSIKAYLTIVLLVLMVGCTTTKSFDFTPAEFQQKVVSGDIELVGETIIVSLKDGSTKEMKVTKVQDDRLVSKTVEVKFDDIEAVNLKSISKSKTLGAYLVSSLVVSAIATLVFVNKID